MSAGVSVVQRAAWALGLLVAFGASTRTPALRQGLTSAVTEVQPTPLKVLLIYDMEGASGVVDDATMNPERPASFAVGRESVIHDVNAVIAGLFDAGVAQVDVRNSHGYGGDSLVPRARLDARARISEGGTAYNPASVSPDSVYTAIVTVAMHDKPLSGGFAPHTAGTGTTPVINGEPLTETDLVAYAFGTIGIPVIFSSGDDHLQISLGRTLPWLEYVVVKRVTPTEDVEPLSAERVRVDLRAGAARAIQRMRTPNQMRAVRVNRPIRAGLVATYPTLLSPTVSDNLPGIERRGDTVTYVVADYAAAFRTIRGLSALANQSRSAAVIRALGNSVEGRRLLQAAQDTVFAQWEAFEKGKWDAPSPPYSRLRRR